MNGIADFIVNTDDPRYIECEKTAQEIGDKIDKETGKTYRQLLSELNPKNPTDLQKITAIEKEIVETVNGKIHEQFGDYNTIGIEQELQGKDTPSLHNDIARQNTDNPAQLSEFKKGELICRHYDKLGIVLLLKSGMETRQVHSVESKLKNGKDGKVVAIGPFLHVNLKSPLTGNIAEFTADNSLFSYGVAVVNPTLEELKNSSIMGISLGNGRVVSIQKLLENGSEQQTRDELKNLGELIAQRINDEVGKNGSLSTEKVYEIIKNEVSLHSMPQNAKNAAKASVDPISQIQHTGEKFMGSGNTVRLATNNQEYVRA